MSISEKIKQLRQNAKLTQVELAFRAGVGLRFLRELEQGKTTVRVDKVTLVLSFFGCHLEVERDERK
jgi:y4mF family transcriptional regulator